MMDMTAIQERLCKAFCAHISVRPVPCGFAVSTIFKDSSGDRLRFYVIPENGAYRLEDSGDYLSTIKASGIDFDQGPRNTILNKILQDGGAYWDQDSYEIRTDHISEDQLPERMAMFITSLARARDMEFLTKKMVKSTFREDALKILEERYQGQFTANNNACVDADFRDFPSDMVLRATQTHHVAALYFVSGNEKLLEAQLMLDEARSLNRRDVQIIALVESLTKVSHHKFQRAQNRGLSMPIFLGDETAAMRRVGDALGLCA